MVSKVTAASVEFGPRSIMPCRRKASRSSRRSCESSRPNGRSCRGGCADEFGMNRFDVAAAQRAQLFTVADEQSQIAEAIDPPGNAVGQLKDRFNGRGFEDQPLRAGEG